MARERFVTPDSVRLPLSEGDWIDVKKELTAGDARKMFTDLVKDLRAGERASLDPAQVGLTKILTYVIGWSLTQGGKPVPFTASALLALRQEDYQEISAAVDAHEAICEAARDERKNGQAGSTESRPTL